MNRIFLSLPPARYTSLILVYFKTTLNNARASSDPWSGKSLSNKSRKMPQSDISLSCIGQDQAGRGLGRWWPLQKERLGCLETVVSGLKKKCFTRECSAGSGHEGLVVPFTHWFTSMSGKLFLTLCGCFCADDWVQNMTASSSLIWEGFVPAVLRVGSPEGDKREENQAPDDSLF